MKSKSNDEWRIEKKINEYSYFQFLRKYNNANIKVWNEKNLHFQFRAFKMCTNKHDECIEAHPFAEIVNIHTARPKENAKQMKNYLQ